MHRNEIECRFLEIDKEALVAKLLLLGAKDEGEEMLEETIIYDSQLKWHNEARFMRLRKTGDKIVLTYKEHREVAIDGAFETEILVDDYKKTETLLENIGFVMFRHQQKKRHTLKLGNVTFDIDTWPNVPTYVEVEGESEQEIKEAVKKVGLDWKDVIFHDARWVLENIYKIPFGDLKCFTFDRIE